MKEKIHFVISNLDDFDLTFKELIKLNEAIILYYNHHNHSGVMRFVEGFIVYYYMLYRLIQKTKGGKK